MRYLPFLLLAIAVIEIMLFMWAGQYIGFWQTVGLVLASAFIGSFLVQAQGWKALKELRVASLNGEVEIGKTIFTGACLLLAGAFLITPGFLTDITGLLLLVPPLRAAVYNALKARLSSMVSGRATSFTFTNHTDSQSTEQDLTIIDVDGEEK